LKTNANNQGTNSLEYWRIPESRLG